MRQSGMEAEVIGVTKRLRTMKKSDMVSTMTSEIEIGREAQGLDVLLINVVDETLKHVFKEEGVKVIYGYLENNHHLRQKEIAEKPEVFSAGLERLLGSGASVIEKLILKNLYGMFGLRFREKKGYGFSDYVKEVEEKCGC